MDWDINPNAGVADTRGEIEPLLAEGRPDEEY
jgi:hypothetical protein